MIVIPGKAVLIEPSNHLTQVKLEGSKLVTYKNKQMILLPHTVSTCHQLAALGHEVVSPIRTEYNWPGRFNPFNHQLRTAEFLANHHRAFCFNEIGTGKTMSTLWAADFLMSQGLIRKVLIVSTLSTLQRVWADEIFQNLTHRTSKILHGTKAKRLEALNEEADFYIINHDGLKVMCDWELKHDKKFITNCAFDDHPEFDLIILDEGAQFRNSSTDRYDALVRCLGDKGIWWLTGSPMPNSPTDIWAQARIRMP